MIDGATGSEPAGQRRPHVSVPPIWGAEQLPSTLSWTGVTFPLGEFGHLDFWLATMDGFCRLIIRNSRAIKGGFVAPAFEWGSMAVFEADTFAYLTRRPTGDIAPGTGRAMSELGVCAHGPGSDQLANRVADRIQAWDRDRRTTIDLWIEVHPTDIGEVPDGRMIIDKRHTRVIVHTVRLNQ